MEYDADWDVTNISQLQSFAYTVRALQGTDSDHSNRSPYLNNWDVLWLGHCGIECKLDLPFYSTPHGGTIVEPRRFLPYWRDPPQIDRPNDNRLTCTTTNSACSTFYAVSYRGAQRILAALSVIPSDLAEQIDIGARFDVSWGRICGTGFLRFLSPHDSLTGTYLSAGDPARSSSIHEEEGESVEPASRVVKYSTMRNIDRILRGDAVRLAWDDMMTPNVLSEDIPAREGCVHARKEGNLPDR